MDRCTFLQQFEKLGETPNAIAKMRKLVLRLAVQGRLVSQDQNDEPASGLVDRSAIVQKKLTAQSGIKKYAVRPISSDEHFLQNIPSSWVWARLNQLGYFCGGATPSMNNASYWGDGIPWVTPKDMKATQITQSEMAVTKKALKETRLKLIPKKSILIVGRSGILKRLLPVAVTEIECVVNQDLKVLVPFLPEIAPFVQLMLRGHQDFILKALVKWGMTVQSLKYDQFEVQPFPLPPLAEQKRIVAKVDELMRLCDDLEAQEQARKQTRTRLQQSAFHHLVEAREPQSFAAHWHRVRDNFHLLHDTPDSVAELRKNILQLAVQGRLVPQCDDDEPAVRLLERIDTKRAELVALDKLQREPRMKEPRFPNHDLPSGWSWGAFGRITFCRDGERIPIASTDRESMEKTYDYYGASGVIDKVEKYIFDKPLLLIGEDGANLVNRSTPIAFIAEGKYWVNNHAHVLDGINRALLEYLCVYINSISLEPYLTGMAQPKMNQAKMNSIPVPVPPLAEQKRIVAKVDALMGLCDELENKLTQCDTIGEKLVESTVQHLLAS